MLGDGLVLTPDRQSLVMSQCELPGQSCDRIRSFCCLKAPLIPRPLRLYILVARPVAFGRYPWIRVIQGGVTNTRKEFHHEDPATNGPGFGRGSRALQRAVGPGSAGVGRPRWSGRG